MQKDTKLESPRERWCPRILDQGPQQPTTMCFLTNEENIEGPAKR